jgi:hypothetical protein
MDPLRLIWLVGATGFEGEPSISASERTGLELRMGKLIYLMNVSLDGYVETPDHSLDWANVDEELHTWFNDRARESERSCTVDGCTR